MVVLPAPLGPEQAEHLAGLHRERDPVDGVDRRLRVALDELGHLDRGRARDRHRERLPYSLKRRLTMAAIMPVVVPEAQLKRTERGLEPAGRGLVRPQRARGEMARRRVRRLHAFRGRRALPEPRLQHRRVGSRPALLHVPRRGGPGGLPGARRRVPAADRGRGTTSQAVGLRPLSALDRARIRRRRQRSVRASGASRHDRGRA